jgi:hypothetical protein
MTASKASAQIISGSLTMSENMQQVKSNSSVLSKN